MLSSSELTQRWGWENPPAEVKRLAHIAADSHKNVGRALVLLELLDEASISAIRSRRGEEKDLLELAAFEAPAKVQPYIEMVNALCNGYPFYAQLKLLTQHPAMKAAAVIRRCEELDCALMQIEDSRPVVVFSTLKAMLQYQMSGRGEKSTDPLLQEISVEMPLLAVGSRDDISAILGEAGGNQEGSANSGVQVWHSTSSETKQQAAQREITRLLDHAIENKASDIALVPQRDGSYTIFIRRWGALVAPRTATSWNSTLASDIVAVLQNKSGANPSNTSYKNPRDGQISYRSPVGDAFLRLSFIPLNHLGEVRTRPSVSIRLFSHSESKVDLESLGLPAEAVRAIDDAVRMPAGAVLLVGPMNSGKSSTIAGALGRHIDIYGDAKKRVSVEDPIERFIGKIIQLNVPDMMLDSSGERVDDDKRHIQIIRGLKRHDINVFWIGEVRDRETAEFCVTTATSGHLSFSTLHAKTCVLGLDILSQMVKPDLRFQLAESVALIISQRLVPALCPHCKVAGKPKAEEKRQWQQYMQVIGEELALPGTIARATPHATSGCPHCDDGYSGYAPVCEVLPFTREVQDAAAQLVERVGDVREARARMNAGRTLTLAQSGLRHLAAKAVDFQSIIYL